MILEEFANEKVICGRDRFRESLIKYVAAVGLT